MLGSGQSCGKAAMDGPYDLFDQYLRAKCTLVMRIQCLKK